MSPFHGFRESLGGHFQNVLLKLLLKKFKVYKLMSFENNFIKFQFIQKCKGNPSENFKYRDQFTLLSDGKVFLYWCSKVWKNFKRAKGG